MVIKYIQLFPVVILGVIQFSAVGLGVAESKGNLTINTDYCYLKNIWIKGTGATAASTTESFKLNANYVTYDNCKTSNRLSNVDFVGFKGSGTPLHNTTSKYRDCSVFEISGTDKIYGFKSTNNLQNCLVYNITGTVDTVQGFDTCNQLSNCVAHTISVTSQYAYGFYDCQNMGSCYAESISSTNYPTIGFYGCYQISGCKASTITSTANSAGGFEGCAQISSSFADTITSTDGGAYGFNVCSQISGCRADTITSTNLIACGYWDCNIISGCVANNISGGSGGGDAGYGFYSCFILSSCRAENISGTTNNGFNTCTHGSSLYTDEAANAGNDYFDTVVSAGITNEQSCPNRWT